MNSKLGNIVLSMLLVIIVEGCWAVEANHKNTDNAIKTSKKTKVIEEGAVLNPKWCGKNAIVYLLSTGEVNKLGHDTYDELYLTNVTNGSKKLLAKDVNYFSCSPDGQQLFYQSKYDSPLYRLNIATGKSAKIVEQGAMGSISRDGSKLVILNHGKDIENVYRIEESLDGSGLNLFYFNELYNPGRWDEDTNSITIRDKEYKRFGRFYLDTKSFEYFHENVYFSNGFSGTEGIKFTESGNLFIYYKTLLKCDFQDKVNLSCNKFLPDSINADAYGIHPSGARIYYYDQKLQGIMVHDVDKNHSSLLISGGGFPVSSRLISVVSGDGKYLMHLYFSKLGVTRLD